MTEAEVIQILGAPPVIVHPGDWHYSRWGNPGWLEVSFDERGRFIGVNDESAFP
jgi:hypothetical protein